MNKKDAIKLAKQYFDTYPKVDEFHITADEQAFQDKTQAANHAKTLKGDENHVVISVTREDEIEASGVIVAPLVVSVPDGTTVNATNPDSVNVVTDSEAQTLTDAANKKEASDTKPIDAKDVKTSAESIDDKEAGGDVVDMKTEADKATGNKNKNK